MAEQHSPDLVHLTSKIVTAYVSYNPIAATSIPELLALVHRALIQLGGPSAPSDPEPPTPPVAIRKSVTPDHLISLEDGKPYKSLKRHLAVRGLTPAEYRTKWGLPADYPMVAAAYSEARAKLAKQFGLGRKPGQSAKKSR